MEMKDGHIARLAVFAAIFLLLASFASAKVPRSSPVTVELLGPAMTMPATILSKVNNADYISARGTGTVTISPEVQAALVAQGAPLASKITGEVSVFLDQLTGSPNVGVRWDVSGGQYVLIVRNFGSTSVDETASTITVSGTGGEAVVIGVRGKGGFYSTTIQGETFTVSR